MTENSSSPTRRAISFVAAKLPATRAESESVSKVFELPARVTRTVRVRTSEGRPAQGSVVEILARYPVGRGQSLIVLRVARRVLLLHQAGTSMTTLSEFADPVARTLEDLERRSKETEAKLEAARQQLEGLTQVGHQPGVGIGHRHDVETQPL